MKGAVENPRFDAIMEATMRVGEVTKRLPQVSVPTALGSVLLDNISRRRLTPFDIMAFPNQLEQPHYKVLADAAQSVHGPFGAPTPSNESQKFAAGLLVNHLMSAVDELSKGDAGQNLGVIPKMEPDDPRVQAAQTFISNDVSRHELKVALDTATRAILADKDSKTQLRKYRERLEGIFGDYGPIDPAEEPERFDAKVKKMNAARDLITKQLRPTVTRELLEASRNGYITQFTEHQLEVLAHNVTRWEPDSVWFPKKAPAPEA